MRWLGAIFAVGGTLLMGYSGQLSPVWPDVPLVQLDWFLLAGLVCIVGAGLLVQVTWPTRHG
jgi:hypothetical protein